MRGGGLDTVTSGCGDGVVEPSAAIPGELRRGKPQKGNRNASGAPKASASYCSPSSKVVVVAVSYSRMDDNSIRVRRCCPLSLDLNMQGLRGPWSCSFLPILLASQHDSFCPNVDVSLFPQMITHY